MADSDNKKRAIPEWQKQTAEPASKESATTPEPSKEQSEAGPRTVLLEQASKFLEDESIRDAPTDRKVSFLESKGLRQDEIDKLLGISRNPEASSESSRSDAPSSEVKSEASTESTSSQPTSQRSLSETGASQDSTKATSATSSRDVPPIITYPEFLVEASKPPPLFTFRSILYTLYGAAGLGATIYGASEYLVKPMLQDLNEARHDLAQTTQRNLRELNGKLEQNVSMIPPYPTRSAAAKNGDDVSDADSITSDPTELFHRDIATQTTPDLSRTESNQALSSDLDEADSASDPTKPVASHVGRLQTIRSHMQEFLEAENKARIPDDLVRDRLSELQSYLDGLTYSGSSYLSNNPYGVYASGSTDNSSSSGVATGILKGEEDAISEIKSEIRGVKGALLSARNFPSGRGGRIVAGGTR
ncbi:peroxisomal membrane anchor protein, putative [Paecilomyces variotii No. 5]|uniref:Peroxisomal membrane protein PEX14 n=1 Tax=Byssochlamys spectabilis (strain No. 5 / NBRC 109023) TaxID=1356009 RepID=V5GDQ9_BYSSN|nr:peroxisomal membrane anchor protein, putative [Paecilomyces variotii No. 5]